MEEKNKVSIWLGNFDNEDLFDDFMEEKYGITKTSDFDFIGVYYYRD